MKVPFWPFLRAWIITTIIIAFRVSVFCQTPMVGKYPLETEGEKIIRLYDVSGNGRHGSLTNNSKSQISSIYNRAEIFRNVSCIRKITKDDATISIPNVYGESDAGKTGFTITFFIYLDTAGRREPNGFVPVSIVQFPDLTILQQYKADDRKTYCQFTTIYNTKKATGPQCEIVNFEDFEFSTGWYYIAIQYSPYASAKKGVSEGHHLLNLYTYYLDGQYNPNANAMAVHTAYGYDALVKSQSKDGGVLLDSKFVGRIWNITFYDQFYLLGDVNADRNNSYFMAISDSSYANKGAFYVVKSATSYYPCTNKNLNPLTIDDPVGNRNSLSTRGVSFVDDRFGRKQSAILMDNSGNVDLPPFYDSKSSFRTPGFDARKGYTISFWTYIDRFLYPPDDLSKPFLSTDTILNFFHLSCQDYEGGLSIIGDRLVINRFMDINPPRFWKMWLWDPVSFQDKKGWYHVIFSQKENAMRVVMYKPGGELAATMNYFNSQDYKKVKGMQFGFGLAKHQTLSTNSVAYRYLDDVRIFSWPFSDEETAALHRYEAKNPN